MLIKTNEYIYRNGSYTLPEKVVYGDYLYDPLKQDILESTQIQFYKDPVLSLDTCFRTFYLKPRDSVESLQTIQARDLKVQDLFIVPKSSRISSTNLKEFDISKYLLNKNKDISTIDDSFCELIGVPKMFLKRAMVTGVPEQEYYSQKLNDYLLNNGFESIESFYKSFLEQNVRTLKKRIPVNENFLILIKLLLTNRFKIEDHKVYLYDTSKYLIKYLEQINVNFVCYPQYTLCNSLVLSSLFLNYFEDLSFLAFLPTKLKNNFKEFLLEEKFITGSLKSLTELQSFYFSIDVITRIEAFSDTESILVLVDSSNYIQTIESFLFPILSITSESHSNLLEII